MKCPACPLASRPEPCPAVTRPHPRYCALVDPAHPAYQPIYAALLIAMAEGRPPDRPAAASDSPPARSRAEITLLARIETCDFLSSCSCKTGRRCDLAGYSARVTARQCETCPVILDPTLSAG